jgi:hypothetical protein
MGIMNRLLVIDGWMLDVKVGLKIQLEFVKIPFRR